MGSYRELAQMPSVKINNKKYVDVKIVELFVRCAIERLDFERKDCTKEERVGIDIAKNVLHNLWVEVRNG